MQSESRVPAIRDLAASTPPADPGAGWGSRGVRLRSVDVMRGMVLALMVFTPPIRYSGTYPHFGHAAWLGWTISDLVFPLFLFISGLSLAFLLRGPVDSGRKRRLVRRLLALLVIGIAYNAIGEPLDPSTIRLTGVLQLIGISGALAALAVLLTRRPDGSDRLGVLASIAGLVVLVYGAVLVWSPGSCERFAANCNPSYAIDEAILGRGHLYVPAGDIRYDPEGLIVSVVAAALVLFGYLAARAMATMGPRRAGLLLATVGIAGVLSALVLEQWLPMSKRLLTPTFLVFVASIGTVLFVGMVFAFDLGHGRAGVGDDRRWRGAVAWPFIVLGANALAVFLAERILIQAARKTSVDGQPTSQWLLESIGSAPSAALVLSTGLLLIIFGITAFMRWRGWRVVL